MKADSVISPDNAAYAAKMRQLAHSGVDMEVDVRFIDMLAQRESTILDVGCGIGTTVHGLRSRGHEAYGVDPAEPMLTVAAELFDASWFRALSAAQVNPSSLAENGLPTSYDVVIMAGNVPAFLSASELSMIFESARILLNTAGLLVVGTTVKKTGGPHHQDEAASDAGLSLLHRYSDWHLAAFTGQSAWSVSVFSPQPTR